MTKHAPSVHPEDQARVSVLVKVPQQDAFRIFTEDIDSWWQRGPQYRVIDKRRGMMHLEPRVGGRVFESYRGDKGDKGDEGDKSGSEQRVFETGRVLVFEPPVRLMFEWRTSNFGPSEKTEVEVTFAASASGTLVTVTHRGWAAIRKDHPVRHGLDAPAFLRMKGSWWGSLMTSMREFAAISVTKPHADHEKG